MAKCLYNGLNYPFYIVSAWMWVKDKGEYDLFTLTETEDYEEAMKKLNSVKLSADCVEVKIEMDTGDDIQWMGTRDEYGFYNT